MMWIPKRTAQLFECWVSIAHVVSIYHTTSSVFIELDTGRTLVIKYDLAPGTDAAPIARRFVDSMTKSLTDDEKGQMPQPVDGSILYMRQ